MFPGECLAKVMRNMVLVEGRTQVIPTHNHVLVLADTPVLMDCLIFDWFGGRRIQQVYVVTVVLKVVAI